jgi:hypothetical protein
MKFELTEFKNESGRREFQVNKFKFESSSNHKKCQSLCFPSVIYIIFYIYLYFQLFFHFF